MRQILGTFNRVDILCHEQLLDHLLILLFHFQDKTASYHPFALKGDKTALQMCLQYKLESSFCICSIPKCVKFLITERKVKKIEEKGKEN